MSRRTSWLIPVATLLAFAMGVAGASPARSAPAADCAGLVRLRLDHTQIVEAVIAGPEFHTPGAPAPFTDLPPFCRVSAVISPAIRFELWLPMTDWNGKFEGTGNGGYNGVIVYTALAAGLRRHYATASTDMGHRATTPDPGSWALHHPELVADQSYRAQHETALKSKAIIRAFYGKPPGRSYFVGCSSGGWQALTEAHRYPHEYDGIVAGAPASEVVHLHAATIWTHLAAARINAGKLQMITDAVLAKCDADDGVKDGLLGDPRECKFQPAELACRTGQAPDTCLTPEEVGALEQIYAGLRYSSGEPIYPGWPRGLEYALALTQQPFVAALASSTFKDMVFDAPDWDFRGMDYDRDVRLADAKVGAVLNDGSPDLREFRRAGGKLILWHGWSDPLISALHTVAYYEKLAAYLAAPKTEQAAAVAQLQDFARLFLAPGVNHCGGGPGPDTFDALGALEKWVEQGTAPASLLASHQTEGQVDRTRPLCAYPQTAVYSGQGDINLAASFTCR